MASTADVAETLVDNHRTFLAFLTKRVQDEALAEDILQDAFVRGLDKAESIRGGEEAAVAWFYRVLRNAVIDHYRRKERRHRGLDAFAKELEHLDAPPADVDQAVCACVSSLAATLKPEYAEALRRVEIDGVPVKALAAELGITPTNAGVRIFRAREALRKQVARSCGTCATHGCLDCTCGG